VLHNSFTPRAMQEFSAGDLSDLLYGVVHI
jgi:hypothetical protein